MCRVQVVPPTHQHHLVELLVSIGVIVCVAALSPTMGVATFLLSLIWIGSRRTVRGTVEGLAWMAPVSVVFGLHCLAVAKAEIVQSGAMGLTIRSSDAVAWYAVGACVEMDRMRALFGAYWFLMLALFCIMYRLEWSAWARALVLVIAAIPAFGYSWLCLRLLQKVLVAA